MNANPRHDYTTHWILKYRNLSFKLNNTTVLGSNSSCDLILEDDSIKAFHAEIKLYDSYVIIQKMSTGNVFINRNNVEMAIVYPNNIIQCGIFEFVLLKRQFLQNAPELGIQIQEITSTSNFQ